MIAIAYISFRRFLVSVEVSFKYFQSNYFFFLIAFNFQMQMYILRAYPSKGLPKIKHKIKMHQLLTMNSNQIQAQ